MSNFERITDVNSLNRVLDNAQDKLVILMFFTKNNPECRKAAIYFEKIANNNPLSYFYIIDIDKFEGECRFVKNINSIPRFDCYHFGNMIGSYTTSNEKEIEQIVKYGQQYVLTHSNINNGTQYNQIPTNSIDPLQVQYPTNSQIRNPIYYQYLSQNPLMQQMAQKQVFQQTSPQIFPSQISASPMFTNMPMNTPIYTPANASVNSSASTSVNTPINIPNLSNSLSSLSSGVPNIESNGLQLPTLQQMYQMFQIFQMMQQMGILNIPSTDNSSQKDDTIILPNGDKIIPLSNGKYGLIRNQNKKN